MLDCEFSINAQNPMFIASSLNIYIKNGISQFNQTLHNFINQNPDLRDLLDIFNKKNEFVKDGHVNVSAIASVLDNPNQLQIKIITFLNRTNPTTYKAINASYQIAKEFYSLHPILVGDLLDIVAKKPRTKLGLTISIVATLEIDKIKEAD